MSVSQGNVSTGPVGLSLKAWALIDSTGALVKGSNIASTVKNSAGNFTVNFTAAMSGTNYLVRTSALVTNYVGGSTVVNVGTSGKTTAACTLLTTTVSATPMDPLMPFHVEVYE